MADTTELATGTAGGAAALVDPATTLAARLAEQTQPAVGLPGPVYPGEDLPWALWMEGVEAKVLRVNTQDNAYTMLMRFAPGVELPRHRHMGPVHGWTFSGRWRYRDYDWIAGPGSYVYEDSLSTHTLHVLDDNDEDTVALFVIQSGLVLLNDEGAPWWYEDAGTIIDLYRAGLANAGAEFPEGKILS